MSGTLYGVSWKVPEDDESSLKAGFRPSSLAEPVRRPSMPPKTPAVSSAKTSKKEKPRA